MGCHTWFYTKADAPITEAHAKLRAIFVEELDTIEKIETQGGKGVSKFARNHYKDKEYRDLAKAYFGERLRLLDAGELTMEQVADALFGEEVEGRVYVDGRGWYKKVDEYHDAFRTHEYPDHRLFSLEETLAYIKDPANKCVTYDHTVAELERFWSEYPEGMISFG